MKKLIVLSAFVIQFWLPVSAQEALKVDTIVEHAAQTFIDNRPWVGVSASVIKNGKSYLFNYGSIDKEKKQAPSDRALYEIGSVTITIIVPNN
jgi:serine-type D-Ala-D-Ala carboxypeptidase/endopeptidase